MPENDADIICTRVHFNGVKTTLRVKVVPRPDKACGDDDENKELPNPEIIYSVTDVSDIEQGRGGFVSSLKNKHEDIADEQAYLVRRDSCKRDELAASIEAFQRILARSESEKAEYDPGNEIVTAFAAQYEGIAQEQANLARRDSCRTLDLTLFEGTPPDLRRRHSGFVVSSGLGYEAIKYEQPNMQRRGSARAADLRDQLNSLLPELPRRNSGVVHSIKSKHEDIAVEQANSSRRGSLKSQQLADELAAFKPQRRGSAKIEDLAKSFEALMPGAEVTIDQNREIHIDMDVPPS